MLQVPLCLRLLLCLACLVSTAFAQTTFSRRSYPGTGSRLLRGDFNRDGKPDLLGNTGAGFKVLLNNGDGTFRGPVNTQASWSTALVTSDFNRDGRTDLEGCLFPSDTIGSPSEAAVWMGTGPGTFGQPRRLRVQGTCREVASEDFNQDGKQDFAVIWTDGPFDEPNNGITVFFGDGSGSVTHSITTDHISSVSEGVNCGFERLVAGNYDRRGAPDVVIATECSNDTVSQSTVLFGSGTGTGHFGFSTTDESFRSLEIAKDDVNQDNHLDLVTIPRLSGPHATSGSALVFYINTHTGDIPTWEKRTVQSSSGDGDCTNHLRAGIAIDLNGDSIKDAAYGEQVLAEDCSGTTTGYRLVIKPGFADGSYGAPQQFPLPGFPFSIVNGDFDRDGRLDLAVAAGDSTEVFLNRNNIATCSANSTLRTIKLCIPASVSGSTLRVRANTTSGGPITGMKVYVDNSEAFFTPNDTINKKLTMPSGSHRITVRAWDGQGSFSSVMTVTASGSSCATPSTNRSINICSPVNESTVSNPLRVTAAVRTSNTYHGAKVYIDGVARHTTTSKQVNASFTLSAGRHRISVQAYDTQGAFTKTVFVNVR